jgi:hypothetical protein
MTEPCCSRRRHNWQSKTSYNRRGNAYHYAYCDCGCGQTGRFCNSLDEAQRDAERMQREDTSL